MSKFKWLPKIKQMIAASIGNSTISSLKHVMFKLIQKVSLSVDNCIKKRKIERAKNLYEVLSSFALHFHISYSGKLKQDTEKPTFNDGIAALASLLLDLKLFIAVVDSLHASQHVAHVLRQILLYLGEKPVYLWDVIIQSSLLRDKSHSQIKALLFRRIMEAAPKESKNPEEYTKYLLATWCWLEATPEESERRRIQADVTRMLPPDGFVLWFVSLPLDGLPKNASKQSHKSLMKLLFRKKLMGEIFTELCEILSEDIPDESVDENLSLRNGADHKNEPNFFVIDTSGKQVLSEHESDDRSDEEPSVHANLDFTIGSLPSMRIPCHDRDAVVISPKRALDEPGANDITDLEFSPANNGCKRKAEDALERDDDSPLKKAKNTELCSYDSGCDVNAPVQSELSNKGDILESDRDASLLQTEKVPNVLKPVRNVNESGEKSDDSANLKSNEEIQEKSVSLNIDIPLWLQEESSASSEERVDVQDGESNATCAKSINEVIEEVNFDHDTYHEKETSIADDHTLQKLENLDAKSPDMENRERNAIKVQSDIEKSCIQKVSFEDEPSKFHLSSSDEEPHLGSSEPTDTENRPTSIFVLNEKEVRVQSDSADEVLNSQKNSKDSEEEASDSEDVGNKSTDEELIEHGEANEETSANEDRDIQKSASSPKSRKSPERCVTRSMLKPKRSSRRISSSSPSKANLSPRKSTPSPTMVLQSPVKSPAEKIMLSPRMEQVETRFSPRHASFSPEKLLLKASPSPTKVPQSPAKSPRKAMLSPRKEQVEAGLSPRRASSSPEKLLLKASPSPSVKTGRLSPQKSSPKKGTRQEKMEDVDDAINTLIDASHFHDSATDARNAERSPSPAKKSLVKSPESERPDEQELSTLPEPLKIFENVDTRRLKFNECDATVEKQKQESENERSCNQLRNTSDDKLLSASEAESINSSKDSSPTNDAASKGSFSSRYSRKLCKEGEKTQTSEAANKRSGTNNSFQNEFALVVDKKPDVPFSSGLNNLAETLCLRNSILSPSKQDNIVFNSDNSVDSVSSVNLSVHLKRDSNGKDQDVLPKSSQSRANQTDLSFGLTPLLQENDRNELNHSSVISSMENRRTKNCVLHSTPYNKKSLSHASTAKQSESLRNEKLHESDKQKCCRTLFSSHSKTKRTSAFRGKCRVTNNKTSKKATQKGRNVKCKPDAQMKTSCQPRMIGCSVVLTDVIDSLVSSYLSESQKRYETSSTSNACSVNNEANKSHALTPRRSSRLRPFTPPPSTPKKVQSPAKSFSGTSSRYNLRNRN